MINVRRTLAIGMAIWRHLTIFQVLVRGDISHHLVVRHEEVVFAVFLVFPGCTGRV